MAEAGGPRNAMLALWRMSGSLGFSEAWPHPAHTACGERVKLVLTNSMMCTIITPLIMYSEMGKCHKEFRKVWFWQKLALKWWVGLNENHLMASNLQNLFHNLSPHLNYLYRYSLG